MQLKIKYILQKLCFTLYNCKYFSELSKPDHFYQTTTQSQSFYFSEPINMDSQIQNNQNIDFQAGFNFCPAITSITPIVNSNQSESLHMATGEESSNLDESKLKTKLLQIFRKDRIKYHEMCDKFIQIMALQNLCSNIQIMLKFITQTTINDLCTNKNLDSNVTHSYQLPRQLSTFSSQVSFLASIFSRDKVQVLLQVHSTYHKIHNFLNFLHVSLQSFNFTNQKEWILMKDEIERHLMKYEKNVHKLLEINQSEIMNHQKLHIPSNLKQKKTLKPLRNIQSRLRTQIIKLKHPESRIQEQLNLKQYKREIINIKQKVKELQLTMCAAIRNSFTSWYEKFQTMLDSLRKELNYVCTLIEKAQQFQDSSQKDQIMEFLLITRAKGLEGIIFLEQIYKCILAKLQESRLLLSQGVSSRSFNKMGFSERQKMQFLLKQQSTRENIERLFRKFEQMLNIRADRNFLIIKNVPIVDESESQVYQKVKENENPKLIFNSKIFNEENFDFAEGQSEKKLIGEAAVKQQKIAKYSQNKNIKSPIISFAQNRNVGVQFFHKDCSQKIDEALQQKESSSLHFLIPQISYLKQKLQDPSIQPENASRKIVWHAGKKSKQFTNRFSEIESLSFEVSVQVPMKLDSKTNQRSSQSPVLLFQGEEMKDDVIQKL